MENGTYPDFWKPQTRSAEAGPLVRRSGSIGRIDANLQRDRPCRKTPDRTATRLLKIRPAPRVVIMINVGFNSAIVLNRQGPARRAIVVGITVYSIPLSFYLLSPAQS